MPAFGNKLVSTVADAGTGPQLILADYYDTNDTQMLTDRVTPVGGFAYTTVSSSGIPKLQVYTASAYSKETAVGVWSQSETGRSTGSSGGSSEHILRLSDVVEDKYEADFDLLALGSTGSEWALSGIAFNAVGWIGSDHIRILNYTTGGTNSSIELRAVRNGTTEINFSSGQLGEFDGVGVYTYRMHFERDGDYILLEEAQRGVLLEGSYPNQLPSTANKDMIVMSSANGTYLQCLGVLEVRG